MGLTAPRHVGSSRTKDWTHVPFISRWILNHWTTKEVLVLLYMLKTPQDLGCSEPGGPAASTLPLPTTGSFQVQQRETPHSPSAFSPELWMNCYRVIFIWLWCYLNIDYLWKQQTLDQTSESFFQSLLEGESKYFVQVHGEWKQKQDILWRVLLCGNSVGLKPGRVRLVEFSINRRSQWGDTAHKARPCYSGGFKWTGNHLAKRLQQTLVSLREMTKQPQKSHSWARTSWCWGVNIHESLICARFYNIFYFTYLFMIFAVRGPPTGGGLSLVMASGGHSRVVGCGFSLRGPLLLWSSGSRASGFCGCGSWTPEHRPNCCGAPAQLLCGMWGYSWVRDRNEVSCIGSWILHELLPWATREAQFLLLGCVCVCLCVSVCVCVLAALRSIWDLSCPPRIGLGPHALGVQSLNHWTAKEAHCVMGLFP